MALSAQKFREIVFQMLFSLDLSQSSQEALVELMMHELSVSKRICQEAYQRAEQIIAVAATLDELISQNATSYDIDRIHTIERNVLRLALYEMLYEQQTPPLVCIAEGIRLTRKFSAPESAGFVNAILDAIYQKRKAIGDEPFQQS